MTRPARLDRWTPLLAIAALGGLAGCSVALDFDSLTNGACGASLCPVWNVPCHSVFVPSDEKYAYVTRYRKDGASPGLYRIDLAAGTDQLETLLFQDGVNPAAGIAGDESAVVFAIEAAPGSIQRLSLDGPGTAVEKVDDADDALGVALVGGAVYWTHAGGVTRKDASAQLTSWSFAGGGKYVAVDSDGTAYASTDASLPDVLQLSSDGMVSSPPLFESIIAAGGVTVRRLPRAGDGEEVPHVFVVTAYGAKVAWTAAGGQFEHKNIADNDADAKTPGEVATDDTHVYWTTRHTGGEPSGGHVFRKALSDLDPKTSAEKIAADQPNPNGLAVTATSVYWCSAEGLYRVPKSP